MESRRKGTAGLVLGLALFVSPSFVSGEPEAESRWIEAVRTVSVNKLDPSLPDRPLEGWLTSLAPQTSSLTWTVNACGEQTGDPARDHQRDFPACVSTSFAVDEDTEVQVRLVVGTFERGMTGTPKVHGLYVERPSGTEVVERLNKLQEVVTRK